MDDDQGGSGGDHGGTTAEAGSGAEFAALMTASVLTTVVGAYAALVEFVVLLFLFWLGPEPAFPMADSAG
ncbi:hypothetical protein [Arthrobacter sp. zg-Y1171]|uniref:hypothetical protein n=1 Tax=Arthrobacter sp. zg-Y1171 TaxID=2964610 RepID=UPI002106E6A0|nr:hypothetical protein [Arthrobacter sp. zg-Y1171]MCQ1995582.1 hypothetical protein [Arthrobacter sp. zg-Y1171]UWX80394.1 hypothetical protein N2L00_08005 [Arthrobacter sp. zg-Y1171]